MGALVDPVVIVQILLAEPGVMAVLVLGLALSVVAARPLGHRYDRPSAVAAASVVAVAGILAVSVLPQGSWSDLWLPTAAESLHSLGVCADGWTDVWPALQSGWDGPMNVALYLPAGLFLTWLCRSPVRVTVALSAMSLTIELYQILISRSCQAADWVANSLGALVGALIAALLSVVLAAVGRSARAAQANHPRLATLLRGRRRVGGLDENSQRKGPST